jgi:putative ATP-binding cassette transporter
VKERSGILTLALVVAAFSIVALLVTAFAAKSLPLYVSVSGLALAGILYAARGISPYVRVFIIMYAFGYLGMGTLGLLSALGWLPAIVEAMRPPDFSATAAAVFAAIVYGVSFLPVIRRITDMADPYYQSDEPATRATGAFKWMGNTEGQIGQRLVALSIFISFAQVAMNIRVNLWYRDLFNALQDKNADAFWYQLLGIFVPLATVWIIIGVYDVFVDYSLWIRWRSWLTKKTYGRWLGNGTHYRVSLAGDGTDNPDQRIQYDINQFVQQTMSFSIRLMSQAATLVSFIVILWGLSRDFIIPGTDSVIPGLLVWMVIAWALIGTWLTHLIGRKLIALDFHQERVEADFRFSLARLREYTEQVALLRGERAEEARLGHSFSAIIANFLQIINRRMKITAFTGGYNQSSVVFPYILAAPSFFLGKITLGVFQQTASAFNRVDTALSFFVNAYTTLASYKATTERLATFNESMRRAESLAGGGAGVAIKDHRAGDVVIENLKLAVPDGRTIVRADELILRGGESALLTGPSGSGKSTLFRALAGIWPYASGDVRVPGGKDVMLVPQRPYLPTGSLRTALAYPGVEMQYPDAEIRGALDAVGLGQLADSLDVHDNWGQRLSGGEQQRVAIVRALLAKPEWLFLDESTASLDDEMEEQVYATLRQRLPGTTIVSIGHRATLKRLHQRRIEMRPSADGTFAPADAKQAVPA